MTYAQLEKALHRANTVRCIVKEELKQENWQDDFEITLSFEEEIDDSEKVNDYSEFVFECHVNGLKEYIVLPMKQFLNDTFYLDLGKITDSIKDYFIEEFSY